MGPGFLTGISRHKSGWRCLSARRTTFVTSVTLQWSWVTEPAAASDQNHYKEVLIRVSARLFFLRADDCFHGSRGTQVLGRVGSGGSKQRHYLPNCGSHRPDWIHTREFILHRPLWGKPAVVA